MFKTEHLSIEKRQKTQFTISLTKKSLQLSIVITSVTSSVVLAIFTFKKEKNHFTRK